jgi:hypothetical protein
MREDKKLWLRYGRGHEAQVIYGRGQDALMSHQRGKKAQDDVREDIQERTRSSGE